MLFNSYTFILGFLPATFAIFFALAAWHHRIAAAWLAAASLFFYGWWNPGYVVLLIASILANFLFGSAIARAHSNGDRRRGKLLLTVAVGINLALLGYYKYAGFLLSIVDDLSGASWALNELVLPLGISFFTFTQIAFLVDAHLGKAKEYNFIHYTLFVTYFPHLIAGPVLHHKEMMPQFALADTYRIRAENIAVGGTIFLIGLFKKTVLADGIAPHVGPAFAAAQAGETVSFFDAWGGALAYTLQLYFDFSGYSDMAIGLSRLFGIRLPLNFNSPYKAANIIDFWRRWHMTLSRFLRDYLYVPLGGNRRGAFRRYANLGITMVLGGLWHGAGWTFVVWGALHGAYLMANHAWIGLRRRCFPGRARGSAVGVWAGRTLTLLAVVVGWVFFRAQSLDAASSLLGAMAGANGIAMPGAILSNLGIVGGMLQSVGIEVLAGGGARFATMYLWIVALMLIVLLAPNTQELMERFEPALDHLPRVEARGQRLLRWTPSARWAAGIGVLGAAAALSLSRVSEFLYFQF